MTKVRFFFCAFMLLIMTLAFAQDVHQERSGYGSMINKAMKASDDQGYAAWRKVSDEEPGTNVYFSFDSQNVDISFVVPFNTGQEKLLNDAKRIAKELNFPETDFIWSEGRVTRMIDLEFNDYLQQNDRTSRFEWDLYKVVQSIEGSKILPRPINYCIDQSDAKFVKLFVNGTASKRDWSKSSFFTAKDIKPGDLLRYEETISVFLTTVGWGLLLFLVGAFCGVVGMPWYLAKIHLKSQLTAGIAEATEPSVPKSPEEVQKEYLKNRKVIFKSVLKGLWPMVFVFPLLFRNSLDRAPLPEWISVVSNPFVFPIVLGAMGLSFLLSNQWRKEQVKKLNIVEKPKTEEQIQAELAMKPMKYIMIPLAFMMGFLVLMPFIRPYLRNIDPTIFRVIVFSPAVIGFSLFFFFSRRSQKQMHEELKSGEPWFDYTMKLAAQAKTKIRGVRIQKTSMLNASASIWRIVTINRGLLEKLPDDEIKAIIAHEVGHIRYQHVAKAILLSFALEAPIFYGYFQLSEWLNKAYEIRLSALGPLIGPITGLAILPIVSWQKRRAEREADRFALEVIGDLGTIERALTAIHTLSEAPHELVKFDEMISSHPSLKNRLKALRENTALKKLN